MIVRTYAPRPFATLTVRCRREPALFRALFRSAPNATDPAITLELPGWRARLEQPSTARGSYKGIPWRLAETATASGRRIEFASPVLASYLALHIAVLPALRELLAVQGEVMLAGAAFLRDRGGVLLLGDTGSGKTAALLRAVARGCVPVADEYLSVDSNGVAHALLEGIALRQSIRDAAPKLYRRLPRRDRVILAVARAMEVGSRRAFRPLVHIGWDKLGAGIAADGAVPIASVLWLDASATEVRPARPDHVASMALRHMRRHDRAYGVSPGDRADVADLGECVTKAFSRAACYIAPSDVDLAVTLETDPTGPAAAQ